MLSQTFPESLPRVRFDLPEHLPRILAAIGFLALFGEPLATLVRDWWQEPDAGHGLLLAPLAIYLAAKQGIRAGARGQQKLGLALLCVAIAVRFLAGLAAEMFTLRAAALLAALALVIFWLGARQLLHWWLPVLLLTLTIPLPAVVLGSIALPMQFQASKIGAAMLAARYVPVELSGNVLFVPGTALFVTEACSGLRSLSALISLALLIGAFWLRFPLTRALLVAAAIPVAIALNGFRVFLTGFLVYYVSPAFGNGFMHMTEGWLIFIAALGILASVAWVFVRLERLRGGAA